MKRTLKYRKSVLLAALVLAAGVAGRALGSAEQDKEVPWEKVYQQTSRSFVIVSYHLKKSDRPGADAGVGYDREYGTVLQHILNKNTIEVVGVIVGDKGEVFTFDRDPIYPETVAKITVKGLDGTVVPARADRMLLKAPGQMLRIEGDLPAGWRALQFAEIKDVTPQTSLYVAAMKPDKEYHLSVRPCECGVGWTSGASPSRCLSTAAIYCVGVICNADGAPVGVTCRDQIDLGPAGPAWRGKDILADAGLPEEQRKQLEEKLKQEFARNIYEVTIVPRPEPKEEDEYDVGGRYASFARRFGGGNDGGSREILMYALAFAPDKLLIPTALPQEMVAGIDTISVKVDGNSVPARFGGVLQPCGATVIELAEGKLPRAVTIPADGRPVRIEPFWAVFVRELAGMDVQVEHSRWIDEEQGYADLWYPVMERPLLAGSWLLDRNGTLVGFFGDARHEHDRLQRYLLGRQSERYPSYAALSARVRRSLGPDWRFASRTDTRIFEAAELAKILGNLPENYDPHIRHLSKEEQKRRVWLGVEYTMPDKEMVKQLDLRRPTEDGRIGLVVNRVYAGSPAAKLGLAEGDVLLSIAVPGAPWPIELSPDERESFDMPDFEEGDVPEEFKAMGLQMPRRRPWPSQDNYLTRMLADIGAGTTVKLKYIHDGQAQEQEFTIEQAPRDMLSAAKYKNEKLGLTVKELTYEVRAALRLKEDDAAVVITQVEQGTPAALARINTYELIRAVDGESVGSVEAFEKLITAAQQDKKESVRLTVEWMGKTRLADLKFEAAAPGGLLKSTLRGRE